jgi:hypothetical protein
MKKITNHKEFFEALLAGETVTSTFPFKTSQPEWRLTEKNNLTVNAGFVDIPICFNDLIIKPRTISINGFDVPEPCREALEYGDFYYIASITAMDILPSQWQNDNIDLKQLSQGIVHLTKEAAEQHRKALLSFTKIRKQNTMSKVEIVCIIDRSGSMHSIAKDAIGGFNSFLKEQKSLPGEANLTLVLFDDKYEVLHDRLPLANVPELTDKTYYPRGFTALYDAIGKASSNLGNVLSNEVDKPDKVIVVILTDGAENASKEYNRQQIADIIKHQQEKYAWEFIFLAANQDAFATGALLNINACNTANFVGTAQGLAGAYGTIGDLTRSYRS